MSGEPQAAPPAEADGELRQRRTYNLGLRQETLDENRARIIVAAREIIIGEEALKGFTMEAVAKRANVARMTVYHRFGSKLALLVALFDDIGARGGMKQLGSVFAEPEPRVALERYIALFCAFWASDRLMIRRLRALSKLDHEFGEGIRERDQWRRGAVEKLLQRIEEKYGLPAALPAAEAANILIALTNFDTYDSLAGEDRPPEEVTLVIQRLAFLALGLAELARTTSASSP